MAVGGGLIVAWLIFSLLPNKDIRYFLPVLPFAILLTANVISELKWRKVAVGIIIVLGLFYQLQIMIGSPEDIRILIPFSQKYDLNMTIFRRNYYTTTAPSTKDWQTDDIVQVIRDNTLKNYEPKVVFTGLPTTLFNFYTILYYSQIEPPRFNLTVSQNDWRGEEFAILRYYPDSSNLPSMIRTSNLEEFLSEIPKDNFPRLLATFDQPDGGIINIYDLRRDDVFVSHYPSIQ